MELARGMEALSSAGQNVALSPEHFRRIAHVLYEEAGIAMPEAKLQLANSRLSKRLRALQIKDFGTYCTLVESTAGGDERKNMLAALTTNVTRFFREPHHFEQLEKSILPPLLETARKGGRVRLWSAGCSSGEEPYSLALTILSMMPSAGQYDIRILATDIDPNVLATARCGIYSTECVTSIPVVQRERYFTRTTDGQQMQASDAIRKLITFNELNLVRRWPVKGPFDVIFCRNVAIYFDEKTQRDLWQNFARMLGPDGWLFIGHSERIFGPAASILRTAGITAYTRGTG